MDEEHDAAATPDRKPVDQKLTLHPDDEQEHANDLVNGQPQAFVAGDQTAAGALTPPEGRHPGGPSTTPGIVTNLLDPYNVNGARTNAEAINTGSGILNPELEDHPDASSECAETPDADTHP